MKLVKSSAVLIDRQTHWYKLWEKERDEVLPQFEHSFKGCNYVFETDVASIGIDHTGKYQKIEQGSLELLVEDLIVSVEAGIGILDGDTIFGLPIGVSSVE